MIERSEWIYIKIYKFTQNKQIRAILEKQEKEERVPTFLKIKYNIKDSIIGSK